MSKPQNQQEDSAIKGQQAGRRLSGNQQRELTQEQTQHPERVESKEETMQEDEKKNKNESADKSR